MRVNPFDKFLSVEDLEHIKVVRFMQEKLPDIVFFHVPNEGKKSAFERYKHSKMGALKGCPDFVFAYPKYIHGFSVNSNGVRKEEHTLFRHGLYIELKAHEHNKIVKTGENTGKIKKVKGKISADQTEVLERLNKVGYHAVCCYGSEEAIAVIKEYFKKELETATKNRFGLKK